jgi:hypothetical protein
MKNCPPPASLVGLQVCAKEAFAPSAEARAIACSSMGARHRLGKNARSNGAACARHAANNSFGSEPSRSKQRGRAIVERRDQPRALIPDVSYGLIDHPDLHGLIGTRLEDRQWLGLGRRLLAQILQLVGVVENDRHTIV